ncbi:MAG: hypothetical protein KUG79_05495 [Pseudomonadales bacterium]|nr:hypothetical protein [Pseudomonadales bacterium]
MKLKFIRMGLLLAAIVLGLTSPASAKEPPVAKLVQVSGEVQYSRNGTTWRAVRRTKYLFAGYKIKTGADGQAKLINQQSGQAQQLSSNSEISIMDGEVKVVSGSLSAPKTESANILQGLSNKFAKAQRYTTVRRSVSKPGEASCDSKVRTIRKVALSSNYPNLVWRNACPEYSYRLVIDDTVHEIAANSNAEMIRFAVENVAEGEHSYRVEVLDNDGIVYIPKRDSTFSWVGTSQEGKILSALKGFGDDIFLSTDLLESNLMFVAAMDVYRQYFDENPDDNDMRPLLIGAYHDLKLSDLKKNEARLYNASLEEDF